jgi:hypothetical protein
VAAAGHVEVPPPPSSTRGMVWGPPPMFMAVKGWRGPCSSPCPRATLWPLGWAERAPRVRRGKAFPWGSGMAGPVPMGSGEAEAQLLRVGQDGVPH